MTYPVDGVNYWWYCACLEINKANVLERFAGKPINQLNIDEDTDNCIRAWDPCGRFGVRVDFCVHMADDMPDVCCRERTTIYDHRPKDRFWENQREREVAPFKLNFR